MTPSVISLLLGPFLCLCIAGRASSFCYGGNYIAIDLK